MAAGVTPVGAGSDSESRLVECTPQSAFGTGPEYATTLTVPELNGQVYYIAGPPGMVKGLHTMINEFGVDESDIRTEGFSGY